LDYVSTRCCVFSVDYHILFLFLLLLLCFITSRLAIEGRYCKTVGRRHKEFRNLIRSRRRLHAQPLRGESRVYENSDSLLAFPAFFSHWDRKSVQPICHALRERTRDYRIVIVILLSPLWIIYRNLILILFNLT